MRETKLYSVFERTRGTTRWKRISHYAYKKSLAVRIYQPLLLDYLLSGNMSIERRLRVVTKFDLPEAR